MIDFRMFTQPQICIGCKHNKDNFCELYCHDTDKTISCRDREE